MIPQCTEIKNLSLLKISTQYPKANDTWKEIDRTFPISLEKVCDQLNIYVQLIDLNGNEGIDATELNGASGSIFKKGDGSYQINAERENYLNLPPARTRFTVAHEIGHFILDKHLLDQEGRILERRDMTSYSDEDKKRETKANDFAAELLMPKHYFIENYKSLYKNQSPTEVIIDNLAEHFWVSNAAVYYRLLNLNLVATI